MDNHVIGGARGDGLTAVICECFVLCYEYQQGIENKLTLNLFDVRAVM